MNLNKNKVELAMAKACMNAYDLCRNAEMTYQTYQRVVSKEGNCKPATIGNIAKALNVQVEHLIKNQERMVIVDGNEIWTKDKKEYVGKIREGKGERNE